jgi:hypothetical protein
MAQFCMKGSGNDPEHDDTAQYGAVKQKNYKTLDGTALHGTVLHGSA